MNKTFNFIADAFESIHNLWENRTTHRLVSVLLITVFIISLAVIEMNRQGWLSASLSSKISLSHYKAINLAFSLVLILEVISLIFALPGSMSKAVVKQFEILALIFLRNSFKELSKLPEPIDLSGHLDVLWNILAYGGGALVIFALLGIFHLVRQNLDHTLSADSTLELFIKVKKNVGLCMIIIFLALGIYDIWLMAQGLPQFDFFQSFYTILIFCDIFMVLTAQIFLPQFHAVFRNSGYAFSTLLIRLSLTAPIYYNVLIGTASLLYAIVLTLVCNHFYKPSDNIVHDTEKL